jgi:hypothetical protein
LSVSLLIVTGVEALSITCPQKSIFYMFIFEASMMITFLIAPSRPPCS